MHERLSVEWKLVPRGVEASTLLGSRWSQRGVMPDHALRQALRNLQLSPETIDESVAAIYEHVRNPAGHPVEKDLARLCTSDYTRGALCALASYIAATGTLDPSDTGGHPAPSVDTMSTKVDEAKKNTAVVGSCTMKKAGSWHCRKLGEGTKEEFHKATITANICTVWDRLRRTRSMPTPEHTIDDDDPVVGSCDQATTTPSVPASGKHFSIPPKLIVRVNEVPSKLDNTAANIGLESPGSSRVGERSPRRAPVRTGQWKLGHEIGKGAFGAVHIGLNEDTGDLIAVKVRSLQHADAAEPLYREIELMRQLTHPNIVCYLGAEVREVICVLSAALAVLYVPRAVHV